DDRGNETGSIYFDPVQDTLFHEYKIEVPVVTFSDYPMKMVRISAHAYNSMNDYIRLADAMDRILGG
ncbi:MAG TPA: hypothetical protein GYA09_01290, partial [Firmicutes bacterium]|nr:hypothetical protein [Candidatus Fermentithermobacillaceae bacterium]